MSDWVDVGALLRILVVSVVGGGGLAAVFALGLVGLTAHEGGRSSGRTSPAGLAVAGLCFAVVLAAVVLGIYVTLSKS